MSNVANLAMLLSAGFLGWTDEDPPKRAQNDRKIRLTWLPITRTVW